MSGVEKRIFRRVKPVPSEKAISADSGVAFAYFEGDWNNVPAFGKLHALKRGTVPNFDLSPRKEGEHFGFEYRGLIQIPKDGVYTFYTESDDGSRLYVGSTLVVNNDGLHAMIEKKGVIALAKGFHQLKVEFFQKSGGIGLNVSMQGPEFKRQMVPDSLLFHEK